MWRLYGVSISLTASANNDGNKYDDVISACVNSSDVKKVFFLHKFFIFLIYIVKCLDINIKCSIYNLY